MYFLYLVWDEDIFRTMAQCHRKLLANPAMTSSNMFFGIIKENR